VRCAQTRVNCFAALTFGDSIEQVVERIDVANASVGVQMHSFHKYQYVTLANGITLNRNMCSSWSGTEFGVGLESVTESRRLHLIWRKVRIVHRIVLCFYLS